MPTQACHTRPSQHSSAQRHSNTPLRPKSLSTSRPPLLQVQSQAETVQNASYSQVNCPPQNRTLPAPYRSATHMPHSQRTAFIPVEMTHEHLKTYQKPPPEIQTPRCCQIQPPEKSAFLNVLPPACPSPWEVLTGTPQEAYLFLYHI